MWPASRGVLAGPDPDGQCGQAAVLHFLDCQVHDPPGRRARCGLASSSGQPSGGMFSIAPTVRVEFADVGQVLERDLFQPTPTLRRVSARGLAAYGDTLRPDADGSPARQAFLGTGSIPLNLRSLVDSEARSVEWTMASRGSWRTRAGGRDCVCGDGRLGAGGGASGRTAAGQQTHAARGRDRDAGRRRGDGRSRHSGTDHRVWRHAHPGHGGV